MFRTLYDNDITIWSPQGRIHQLEYAMEAVKQGSACVGLKSETHAVVATIMRTPSKYCSYQEKVFKIDDHMGIAISGLTADGRYLCKYMRNECLNHKWVFESPMPVERIVKNISDKSQVHTQQYGSRPYGVGLLVIGYDSTGPHLYETSPSANYFDFHAQAIGSRSQSAKTYLEKKYKEFPKASKESLIKHALLALSETLGKNEEDVLTGENCSIAIVGKDTTFELIRGERIQNYLDNLNDDMNL
eukprot:TRINITY_DN707_c0_g1_i1.p1 TRINITY_DN707_c0_g1~~TRINITY_DN707_c0_g1_i1.p1  ORF type:complete len:245 (-),score=53.10 TRINITY_DN707_c0_g1_i1:45-779(-)